MKMLSSVLQSVFGSFSVRFAAFFLVQLVCDVLNKQDQLFFFFFF